MTDQAPTRVSIDTPPLTVTCEEPGADLGVVRMHAVEIYREIFRDDMRLPGIVGGVGFKSDLESDRR